MISPQLTIRRGIAQLQANPQLWLTIVVAVAIFASFAFVASRFIGIARDAQDRLVNVRVGALQDAFAPLAAAFMQDPSKLTEHMRALVELNPTIVEFLLVRETAEGWRIVAAVNEDQVGSDLIGYDLLLTLALADPGHSFTVEEVRVGERFFRTARAVPVDDGHGRVLMLTRQSLSEADRAIAGSIRDSIGILVVILAILLFLFFHHARIIDYTALYHKLKEVNALKDDFISMASHELRTPLTVIKGYIEMVREDIEAGKPVDKEALSRIRRSADGLAHLVEDMLDVTRIEQGRMKFEISVMEPAGLLKEICEFIKKTAEAKGLALKCDVQEGHKIKADADRLRQIVTNLVGNAVKYTEKGEVSLRAYEERGQYMIRVSDTGIGIDADEQQKLFGKFHRAPGEQVRAQTGTGLGLWITKQLIEAMDGRISVESIKGVGSHFIVSFPVVKG